MKIKVSQGKHDNNGMYIEPTFPVTDESVKDMLESGLAEKTESISASWGSGIYDKVNNEWVCISSKWDTSG